MITSPLLISIIGFLITVLLSIIAWVGNGMVTKLDSISKSLNDIRIDLSVLGNDHSNLKERVDNLDEKVKTLEAA